MKISKWPWPLTFIWPWPWVWPLTLTIWRNDFFPNFLIFFKVTWRKNVTWYVKRRVVYRSAILYGTFGNQAEDSITSGSNVMAHYVIFSDFFKVTWRKNVTSYFRTYGLLQKRNSINHVMQLTRSLCHFRFKSYGPLCDFHKSGDLDLDFYPISNFLIFGCPWTRIHHMSKNQDDRSSGMACTSRTDGQTNKQTNRQTDRQTDERALRECILCKIGLTDWVIYLVDWQWQRSRTQSIGPNDSNEKCAMSRVLFGINIAAIQKIRDLDLLQLTLTFFLDLWPWHLTLRLIYYYLDALKKTLQKCIVLTSRDAKTAPHMLEWRHIYRLVFCQ